MFGQSKRPFIWLGRLALLLLLSLIWIGSTNAQTALQSFHLFLPLIAP